MKEFIQYVAVLTALFISSSTGADTGMVVYGQVGDTVRLPMSRQETDITQMYVYWYFGEKPVLSRNNYGVDTIPEDQWKGRVSCDNSYTLTIKNITSEEFNTFTCVMKWVNEQVSKITYVLRKVRVEPSTALLLAGEELSLSCEVERSGGDALPLIHWLNPQREKIFVGAAAPRLSVEQVTGQHHGTWTCVVTGDDSEARAKAFVTVIDLSPAPPRVYTSNSSAINIPCSIPAHVSWDDLKAKGFQRGRWRFGPGPASPGQQPQTLFSLAPDSLAWKKEQDTGLAVADLKKNNLNLWKARATEEDRGEYTCVLEFKGGVTLRRSVHVEVLRVFPSPSLEVLTGEQINLTCSLGHTLPFDLQIEWVPPRQSSLRPQRATHLLTIPQASVRDQGRWRCNLRNKTHVLASAEVTLKIERAPVKAWLLVTICGAAVIFILLLILTVILIRRHRQRKTTSRRHKRRFCSCAHSNQIHGFVFQPQTKRIL